MIKLQWQQSLLAIAISSAAMNVIAQDYIVNAGPSDFTGVQSSLNFTGGFTSLQAEPDFILGHSLFADSVTNNATIQVYTDGARPLALVDSSITGSVVNAGTLKTNGALSSGLTLINTLVGGDVKNTGTINTLGRQFDNNGNKAAALNLRDSGIGGNLENSGQIYANGGGSIGVDFSGTQENLIKGGIINSGSISVGGTDSIGLNVRSAKINGSIKNSSLIGATGDGAIGVVVADSQVGEITNAGNINVNAADRVSADPSVVGVYLRNVKGLDANGNAVDLTLNNTRTISSAGVGIKVDDADSVVVIKSSSLGAITGKTAAIEGNGHTILNMAGGNITGDLVGLDQINISTIGRFTSSKIDAASMNLANNSTAYLTAAGTKLTGDLNVSSGAKVDMQLSDETVATNPYLEVGGTAVFAANSSVTVSSKANAFNPTNAGVEYTLLKAGALTDEGMKVASNSYLLDVKSYVVNGNTVKAVVAAKSDDDIGNIENPEEPGSETGNGNTGGEAGGNSAGNTGGEAGGNTGGNTGNEAGGNTAGNTGGEAGSNTAGGQSQNGATGALLAMKNSVLGQLDTSDPVYQALANASTREEVARIAQQLTPEVNGGGSRAAVTGQNIVNNAISNRVSGLRSGMSSGDTFKEAGVWVQALSNQGDQDQRGGVDGYESNSAGIAVGVDDKINDQTTVGVAYSYMNTNVTSDSGDKTEVQGSAFTLYGSYELGNWFADASLSAGKNDNDSKRYIVGTQAKGSYDSDVLSASLLGGYDFRFDNLVVEPRVGARYTNVKIDSYREHGSSAALSIGAQRFEVGEFGAGVRIAGDFPVGMGNLEPEATLMAWHDVIGDKVSSTSSYVLGGNPFVTSGASPVRDSYEATVGATYKVGAVTVGANYGYQTKTDFEGNTVTGRVRYDF
ncbi:autotransporter family protein [Pseudomonas nitroreducens]|uniref:Autotransporter outer membrane beta-barrel domain-containing protein n=1 Tax=Pseudomonas nitroreducens TaxID=46680 RepID=A0A6G6J7Z3_PSENT|nr:autotransporter outer membrane beta-barrel domain-containing protein [Pseudomonas nitroreducens]QIE91392.1 autotransporter outer membrane beta-barrel domain-containing protein [Pseudomonas nitroreducens]